MVVASRTCVVVFSSFCEPTSGRSEKECKTLQLVMLLCTRGAPYLFPLIADTVSSWHRHILCRIAQVDTCTHTGNFTILHDVQHSSEFTMSYFIYLYAKSICAIWVERLKGVVPLGGLMENVVVGSLTNKRILIWHNWHSIYMHGCLLLNEKNRC